MKYTNIDVLELVNQIPKNIAMENVSVVKYDNQGPIKAWTDITIIALYDNVLVFMSRPFNESKHITICTVDNLKLGVDGTITINTVKSITEVF